MGLHVPTNTAFHEGYTLAFSVCIDALSFAKETLFSLRHNNSGGIELVLVKSNAIIQRVRHQKQILIFDKVQVYTVCISYAIHIYSVM